ncbi:hypothetical protein [Natronospora cellulosivora (SeqCode)]
MLTKLKIVFCLILFSFLIINNVVTAEENINEWPELRTRYENFLEEQSRESLESLYYYLLEEKFDRNSEILDRKPLPDFITSENLNAFDPFAEKGDLTALRVLFRLKFFYEEGEFSRINSIIASSITTNPENFLTVLEENLGYDHSLTVYIDALGEDYYAQPKKQAEALLDRYIAIKNVDINEENSFTVFTKEFCLYYLSARIAGIHQKYFYLGVDYELVEMYI